MDGDERERVGHKWRPLEALTPTDLALADGSLGEVATGWRTAAASLDVMTRREVRARLARQWGIETGVIEGLYWIDGATTALLIERGLDAALIAHDDNGRPPELIVDTIEDHVATVDWLFDVVAQQRGLSTGFVREVHAFMTRTQEECAGVDMFGRRVSLPLHHGTYKARPNNPTRPDNLVHEYCPPEQVASEMDLLVALHARYRAEATPADVHAAWLHHRFIHIHPFEDGNGRVGRALSSLVLIEAGWWPMTVTRADRPRYIDTLRAADDGDLAPLVRLVGELQRQSARLAYEVAGLAHPG